jgi:SNF2 family DNA or RNA helicase
MPEGVFITFPSALFINEGAMEYIPTGNGWNGANTEEKFRKKLGLPYDDDNPPGRHDYLSAGVGEHNDGIHCLAKPSLATKMGNIFDMIIVDEAHLIARLSSQTTKSMIRLQPKFRFALTATPIPNMIYNIFAMLGWLSVKDWYAGGRRNARWPYAIGEMDKFKASFVSKEKDLTEDLIRMEAGKNVAPAKDSPVISQKPRLLKLLKRTLAHVSKISCNPELPECEVLDIRVPMGGQQHKDYAKYIDPTNVPAPSPMVVMAKQQQWLRGICAAPAGLKYTTAESNFNPKTIATLEVISKCLERGEQVVHVVARTAQNDEIQRRLEEANIPCSRIDSTVRNPAAEANRFKAGKTKVMLMGIKCAQGYSFENARNLIIGSLEWSYGAFNQAQGRIYRLTSDKKCTVYVILHENSIEELLFDKLGQKEDAATLCLYGKNVPREYKTVNASEIMASHWKNRNKIQNATQLDESFCEQKWDKLKKTLELANM